MVVVPPYEENVFEEKYQAWLRSGGGNRAEFTVWLFLTEKKKLQPGRDFIFQASQMGGRTFRGGVVSDFVIPNRFLVWRVQGETFHIIDPDVRAKDALQKVALEQQGWRVVDIFTRDLAQQRTRVLEAAWEGVQVTFLQTI